MCMFIFMGMEFFRIYFKYGVVICDDGFVIERIDLENQYYVFIWMKNGMKDRDDGFVEIYIDFFFGVEFLVSWCKYDKMY